MKQAIKLGFTVVAASILLSGCSASDMNSIISGGDAMQTSSVKHAPINPSRVKLYYPSNGMPKHYQIVGRVSANTDNAIGIPHSQQSIADELKSRAAALGANGVINISSDLERTSGDAIIAK